MQTVNDPPPNIHKARYSLGRSLLLWFLLLALLPLGLTAWLGYRQSVEGLTNAAIEKLEQGAQLKVQLIHSWFDYRFMDLNSLAHSQRNIEFLAALREGLKKSGQSPADFVQSEAWRSLVAAQQADLITFTRHYDYLYDLFLIDSDGNILFSAVREFDLGTNLFSGPYASTRFAHIARASLAGGQALFSDFEGHIPARELLTGFLTAPVVDGQGNTLGLLAIQLRLERIAELMLDQRNGRSLNHYLVGRDGRLRTPFYSAGTANMQDRRIDTEQFRLWQLEHGEHGVNADDEIEMAFEYSGPVGERVIGLHHTVRLPGASWAFISEINRDEALAAAHRLGEIIVTIFLFTAVLVGLLATYQARRITRPIIQLAYASKAAAAGDLGQQVAVKADNEIGILADAFNEMLSARQRHTEVLEESNNIAQQALAELAEQKFALDQHAIVAITDARGGITFANEKFSEVTGYSCAELLGQNHRLLNSGYHSRAFFDDMYNTISHGKVWHGEICNKAKDGHLYWVDTTIVPFMDERQNPRSYIAIRTDISQRKQAEIELRQAKEAAEAATRQKSDFLANMSHEIRTPMNGIIGMTGLLLETPLNAKQRSYADATMTSADALLTLINDILDFSKIEAGKLTLECVPFDLRCLVDDVIALMAPRSQEKGVDMVLRYKPDTARQVLGDPGRVRQILLNLLSNAVKFTEQGQILLAVESTQVSDEAVLLRMMVKDTGIGIAADKLTHIFNKFDQEDNSTTRKYGGTGLGLAICKQLCAMMHGEISVESHKGKGSAFCFTIRLALNTEAPSVADSPPQAAAETQKPVFDHARILLVEDNPINVAVATELLEGYGCHVTPAGNGREALTMVKARDFDFIFMDCQMPEMDGFEATAAIRTYQAGLGEARTPIVAFTANAMASDQEKCLSAGMDDFITKPVSQAPLQNVLIKWLPHKLKMFVEQAAAGCSRTQPAAPSDVLDSTEFNKLRQLFGDKFPALIEQHIHNARENVERLTRAVQQGDLETLERAAHSLKGASAQFGALRLHQLAVTLERLAKDAALDRAAALLEALGDARQAAAQAMRQQLP